MMALLHDIDIGNGIPMIPGAYLRVQNAGIIFKGDLQLDPEQPPQRIRQASYELHFYADRKHAIEGKPLRQPEYRQFAYQGGDIEAEAYADLKGQPEFAGAEDA